MEDTPQSFSPIEDYAVIGDLRTVALVGRKGSIDCLCFPKFDSPSIFAAHVDRDKGGRFQIEPLYTDCREQPLYLPDTNVLITRFLANEGVAEISNYMVLSEDGSDCEQALVRRAKCVHGEATFRLRFEPRFNYARSRHKAEQESEHVLRFQSEGEDGLHLRLRSDQPLELKGGDGFAEFTLRKGETATFILEEDLVEDSLVFRYKVGEAFEDQLGGTEGTFSICSFWYIECVSRSGDLRKARFLFEKMLSYANKLGLFSEQLGTKGEFLGNIPQAFTHLAMISAAFDLDRRLDEEAP